MSERENKTERVQLLMAPTEVKAIDDWGFANRIRTRAEAIRRLCQIGLGLSNQTSDLTQATKRAALARAEFFKRQGEVLGTVLGIDEGLLMAHVEATAELIEAEMRRDILTRSIIGQAASMRDVEEFDEAMKHSAWTKDTMQGMIDNFDPYPIPDDLAGKKDSSGDF